MENYDSIRNPRQNFKPMMWTSMVLFSLLYIVFAILSCVAFVHEAGGVAESVLEVRTCVCVRVHVAWFVRGSAPALISSGWLCIHSCH